jgi:hypothetical protein
VLAWLEGGESRLIGARLAEAADVSARKTSAVLDASALLAHIRGELGSDRAAPAKRAACLGCPCNYRRRTAAMDRSTVGTESVSCLES